MGNNFLNVDLELIINKKNEIEKKANKAELIKSKFIPAFKSKPIILMGIPYLIKIMDIFSEAEGLTFPIKKPKIKNGIISINNL